MLYYVIERLKRLSHSCLIIVATSEEDADDPIEAWCDREKIACFRGSEEDVLDRFVKAARRYEADIVVRVTGDCPLIDPKVVDLALQQFLEHYPGYDYLSNTIKRTFPRGFDVEVFKLDALERAHEEAEYTEEREHVTPYIWRHPESFSLGSLFYKEDFSDLRLTVDTKEDFSLISKILEALWLKDPGFGLEELVKLLDLNPEWAEINRHIKQKGI